jgi:hypothetical protein
MLRSMSAATVQKTRTLNKEVRAIVARALRAERQRTSRLLLELAERRRVACGIATDPLVATLALLANEIANPHQ